jgi:hypothetical protein
MYSCSSTSRGSHDLHLLPHTLPHSPVHLPLLADSRQQPHSPSLAQHPRLDPRIHFSKSLLELLLVYLLPLLQETFLRYRSDQVMLWIAVHHRRPLLPNLHLLQHLVRMFPLAHLAHHQHSLRPPLPVFQEPLRSVLGALQADRAPLPRTTLASVDHHPSCRTTSLMTAGRSLAHHKSITCIPSRPPQHRMVPRLNNCKTHRDPRPSLVNSGVV